MSLKKLFGLLALAVLLLPLSTYALDIEVSGDTESAVTTTHAGALIGAPAAEEIGVAGTFEVLPTSFTEAVDSDGEWSVQSTNYYCYNGQTTLNDAIVMFVFSIQKTEQAGTQTITIEFGTKTQASLPMVDGDEVGADYQRAITNTTEPGLGTLVYVGDIAQNDCFGVLVTTDTSTPTVQLVAGELVVIAF